MFLHTVCCRGVEYNGQTPATANKRGFSCYFVLNIVKTTCLLKACLSEDSFYTCFMFAVVLPSFFSVSVHVIICVVFRISHLKKMSEW